MLLANLSNFAWRVPFPISPVCRRQSRPKNDVPGPTIIVADIDFRCRCGWELASSASGRRCALPRWPGGPETDHPGARTDSADLSQEAAQVCTEDHDQCASAVRYAFATCRMARAPMAKMSEYPRRGGLGRARWLAGKARPPLNGPSPSSYRQHIAAGRDSGPALHTHPRFIAARNYVLFPLAAMGAAEGGRAAPIM